MIYGPVAEGEKIVGGTKLEIIGLQKKKIKIIYLLNIFFFLGGMHDPIMAGRGTTPVWVLFPYFLSASICVMHVVSMLM